MYTIRVEGGTDPGKEYLTGDKEYTLSLQPRDPASKLQEWQFTTLSNGMFNIALPNGMTSGRNMLSTGEYGTNVWVVDTWYRDDNSGRQKFNLVKKDGDIISSEGKEWWEAILDSNYSVQRVRLVKRSDCCGNRSVVTLTVGDQECPVLDNAEEYVDYDC